MAESQPLKENKMKKVIWIFGILFFLLSFSLVAQEKKAAPPGIESFWKIGEKLTYKFYQNDTLFGTQTTTLLGKDKFQGKPAYRFRKAVALDLAQIKQGPSFRTNGEMFLTEMGKPLSYGLDIFVGDKKQHLEIIFTSDSVMATAILGNEGKKYSKPFDTTVYLGDNSMISDFYIILHFLKIDASGPTPFKFLNPQDLSIIEESIVVEKPTQVKFAGKQMEVSVYRFPTIGQSAWVTKDKKLIRWLDESRNWRIDLELPAPKKQKK